MYLSIKFVLHQLYKQNIFCKTTIEFAMFYPDVCLPSYPQAHSLKLHPDHLSSTGNLSLPQIQYSLLTDNEQINELFVILGSKKNTFANSIQHVIIGNTQNSYEYLS